MLNLSKPPECERVAEVVGVRRLGLRDNVEVPAAPPLSSRSPFADGALAGSPAAAEIIGRDLHKRESQLFINADSKYAPMYANRSRRTKTDEREAPTLIDACETGASRPADRRAFVKEDPIGLPRRTGRLCARSAGPAALVPADRSGHLPACLSPEVRMVARFCRALGVGALMAGALDAQGVPPRRIAGTPQVHPEEFSQLRGARELPDGRLLVSDYIEQRVVALDFTAGTAVAVLKRGGGPGEARLPTRIIAMPGDSSLLVDLGNQRLLVIDPRGKPVRAIPGDVPGTMGVNGMDSRGALYFTIPGWAASAPLPLDTVELVQWRVGQGAGAREVVARIQGDRMRSDLRAPALTPRIPTVGYGARDAWFVSASDGSVRILRNATYALEVIASHGARRTGPSHAYTTSAVAAADRQRYVEEFLATSPTSGRGDNGGMGFTPKPTEKELAALVAGTHFAERFPMFDGNAVFEAPGQRVWVGRPAVPGKPRRYDVLDGDGRMVAAVELPAGERVLTFGRGHVYVVRTGEDGVERIARYRP